MRDYTTPPWVKQTHSPAPPATEVAGNAYEVGLRRLGTTPDLVGGRFRRRCCGFNLVLDDFGLQPLTAQGAQDLCEIISEHYERCSIIITSNRAFEEWGELFGNDLLASAALDGSG